MTEAATAPCNACLLEKSSEETDEWAEWASTRDLLGVWAVVKFFRFASCC